MEKKCPVCKSMMKGRRENYRYTECGLNSVYLRNILVFHCECGAVVPSIPAMSNLHRQIVLEVLKKPTLLSGEEIRFVRKMARFSSGELARLVGVHAGSVSRWENGGSSIGKANDRVLRLMCLVGMLQEALQQSKEESEKQITGFAEWAREVADVNVKLLLESLEDKEEVSRTVTIDPARLAECDTAGDSRMRPPNARSVQ